MEFAVSIGISSIQQQGGALPTLLLIFLRVGKAHPIGLGA
jgi:hypothetical protein